MDIEDKAASVAIKAAYAAGKILLDYQARSPKVMTKFDAGRRSFVSQADLDAEASIIALIKKHFPGHSIISEEKGSVSNKSDYCWYIDPLDGTHNYLRQSPLFGVMIGLAKNGKVIMGVICLPALDEMYYATTSASAYKISRVGSAGVGNAKTSADSKVRLQVSKTSASRTGATLLMDSHLHGLKEREASFRAASLAQDYRTLGSAAIAFAWLASGRADAYLLFNTNSWDMVAGSLIIERAGYRITDIDALERQKGSKSSSLVGEWDVNTKSFLASIPAIHDELLERISQKKRH